MTVILQIIDHQANLLFSLGRVLLLIEIPLTASKFFRFPPKQQNYTEKSYQVSSLTDFYCRFLYCPLCEIKFHISHELLFGFILLFTILHIGEKVAHEYVFANGICHLLTLF